MTTYSGLTVETWHKCTLESGGSALEPAAFPTRYISSMSRCCSKSGPGTSTSFTQAKKMDNGEITKRTVLV